MTRAPAALLALLLLAGPVVAQDRATVLVGSHHIGASLDFEEVNPGLFLTWEVDPLSISVGAYRNSYGRTSVGAFAGLPLVEGGQSAEFIFGFAHYPEDGRTFAVSAGDFVPLVGFHLRAGAASALILPGNGEFADAIIAFGLTWDF